MKSLVLIAVFLASQNFAQENPVTPIAIVSQTEQINPDGSFKYRFETADGVSVEQGGFLQKVEGAQARSLDGSEQAGPLLIQIITGSYNYTAPNGEKISLRYTADDKGFHPEGDHLPKNPEPQQLLKSPPQQ